MRYFARDPGRHYFKCIDCFAPLAIETTKDTSWREEDLRCPHCNGYLAWMGRVGGGGHTVQQQVSDCPCDERCTCAVGPNCDCRCGGANHGIGMVWKVVTVGDTNRLEAASATATRKQAKHAAAGAEWRDLVARYHRAWDAAFDAVTTRRAAGWIPFEDFRLWVAGQNTTKEMVRIRDLRSHARNAKLEKLTEATEALACAHHKCGTMPAQELRNVGRNQATLDLMR